MIHYKNKKKSYINNCEKVDDSFNARFSAIKREYIYKLTNNKSPISRMYTWQISFKINEKLLQESAKLIIGKYDFSSFCKASSLKENNFERKNNVDKH